MKVSVPMWRTACRQNLSEALADALAMAGVERIFCVLSADTARLIVAASQRDIFYHAVRHENRAVTIPDSCTQVSGQLDGATVADGPGFTSGLNAITTAERARSRLLMISGRGLPEEDEYEPTTIRAMGHHGLPKPFRHSRLLDKFGRACLPTVGSRYGPGFG